MKLIARLAPLVMLAAACTEPVDAPRQLTPPSHAATMLTQADGVPVMRNLANPRGLAWGPDSSLYVAEAGRGGTSPCLIVLGYTACYGRTGRVSRLKNGVPEVLVSDLPSWVMVLKPDGTPRKDGYAAGPNGISVHGNGGAYVTIGLETDPTKRDAKPELGEFARLVHISPTTLITGNGEPRSHRPAWTFIADLGKYEIDANPDCGDIDSNPFGVLAVGDAVLIADAGANSIVQRKANGELSTFAAFSNNTTVPGPGCPAAATRDFVPTTIVKGPDGAYYIGHLNGFPVLQGSASVWRMEPGGTPQVYCTGFTFITALAFDAAGNLYVLQHLDGSLTRVGPGCTQTKLITGLKLPTGLAVGGDGAIYISVINGQNFAAEGQVRRFTP